jgi:hypothetical protein
MIVFLVIGAIRELPLHIRTSSPCPFSLQGEGVSGINFFLCIPPLLMRRGVRGEVVIERINDHIVF